MRRFLFIYHETRDYGSAWIYSRHRHLDYIEEHRFFDEVDDEIIAHAKSSCVHKLTCNEHSQDEHLPTRELVAVYQIARTIYRAPVTA